MSEKLFTPAEIQEAAIQRHKENKKEHYIKLLAQGKQWVDAAKLALDKANKNYSKGMQRVIGGKWEEYHYMTDAQWRDVQQAEEKLVKAQAAVDAAWYNADFSLLEKSEKA
jgi:hypothetical protein